MTHSKSACHPIDYGCLKLIGYGGSAVVYGIDESTVLKEYFDETDEGITIECEAFRRLGPHSSIVQCLGSPKKGSLILERGQPLLTKLNEADLNQKLEWIEDAAYGLQHLHRNGIIHSDFGCPNMVLINSRVKIIDFGGCSIDGGDAFVGYNWYSCKDTSPPTFETDIFAFGCALFEILTGKPPYHEYETDPDRGNIVRNLYTEGRFPEVNQLPLREILLGCWHGTLCSMDDVIDCLMRQSCYNMAEIKSISQLKVNQSTEDLLPIDDRLDNETDSEADRPDKRATKSRMNALHDV